MIHRLFLTAVRHWMACLALLGLPSALQAADAAGAFAIRGPGALGCTRFLEAGAQSAERATFEGWLLGYATARNRGEPDTYDVIPTESGQEFPALVAAICKIRPEVTVEIAAAAAIQTLQPYRQGAMSPFVEISSDGRTVRIRQKALSLLQQALADQQGYDGAVDGTASPQFVAAIKAFQQRQKLPVTGLPDIDTFLRARLRP